MTAPPGFTIRFPRKGDPPGGHGVIAFKDRLWKAFQKEIDQKARVQLTSAMKAWCERGPAHLPKQRFKFQDSFEWGGKRVRLETFKGWAVRFYGAVMDVDGVTTFLITGYDPDKKDDQADPDVLKAAARAAHRVIHGS